MTWKDANKDKDGTKHGQEDEGVFEFECRKMQNRSLKDCRYKAISAGLDGLVVFNVPLDTE